MRLSSQKVLLLLAVSSIACRDTTAPATITRQFVLNDINGRTLPTYQSPTPGLAITIVSGSLVLDNAGTAVMTENRIDTDEVARTSTVSYTYRIIGSQLVFEPIPCPGGAMCAGPPVGTISADGLAVEVDLFGTGGIKYEYRALAVM